MDIPPIPKDADALAELLRSLKLARYARKSELKPNQLARQRLSSKERNEIFAKTAGRCHICGGAIEGDWEADHVFAHSGGGTHRADNYLPAHRLCNNYRWDYSAEEFQHILKLGVWLRTQIETKTPIGRTAAADFVSHEARRVKRSTSMEASEEGSGQ